MDEGLLLPGTITGSNIWENDTQQNPLRVTSLHPNLSLKETLKVHGMYKQSHKLKNVTIT